MKTLKILGSAYLMIVLLSLVSINNTFAQRTIGWDRVTQMNTVLCDNSDTVRVVLFNFAKRGSNLPVFVDSVFFRDSTDTNPGEYRIIANQANYNNPFGNFTMNAGDTIWVDVVFTPDLSKPWPAKYANRHAFLTARASKTEADQVITFTGTVLYPAAKQSTQKDSLNYGFLDYGLVPINTPVAQSIAITDTGTAPFELLSWGPITPPILAVNGIKPGDTIFPGQSVQISISEVLTTDIDTFVTINFYFTSECADTVHIRTYIDARKSSVESISDQTLFSLHPNPANGNSIIVTFDKIIVGNAEVSIFNVLGEEIYKRKISSQASDRGVVEIPISNLPNGIYYLKISSGEKVMTKKFEVMR